MSGTVVVCALLVVAGLFGIVVPLLPGTVLVALGIGVWAASDGTAASWTVFGVAACFLVLGTFLKYAVPGRQLKATVPTSTLVLGGIGAVIGFFVIPVVGALAGFPLGIYAAERARVGAEGAWPSTRTALKAVGLSILIELAAALAATATWIVGGALT
jgi:uncharacterized protein YqgC (DUF456 family)